MGNRGRLVDCKKSLGWSLVVGKKHVVAKGLGCGTGFEMQKLRFAGMGDTRNREDNRFFIQGETLRWHCAARREIAERSEEAPEATAAQPSWNVGSWKTPGGCFGGGCKGGREGGAAP